MGSLSLPSGGVVYLDTAPIIYAVERHPDYEPLLMDLWTALEDHRIGVVTSELTLLEVLVKPLRDGNQDLVLDYEKTLTATKLTLLAISKNIIRVAAGLRARTNLKTPDAIHAATAIEAGCSQFITNDAGYRIITSIPIVILKEMI